MWDFDKLRSDAAAKIQARAAALETAVAMAYAIRAELEEALLPLAEYVELTPKFDFGASESGEPTLSVAIGGGSVLICWRVAQNNAISMAVSTSHHGDRRQWDGSITAELTDESLSAQVDLASRHIKRYFNPLIAEHVESAMAKQESLKNVHQFTRRA